MELPEEDVEALRELVIDGRKAALFDDETRAAIVAVARATRRSFQQLADEAFADLLKEYRQPVALMPH